MGLSLDIKVPDLGDWAKQTGEVADHLEKINAYEKKANKESDKSVKQSKVIGDHTRKALGDHKKTTDEEKKQKKSVVDLAASWYLIKDAAHFAYDSVIGLGHSILQIAHDAERSKTGAKAMMDVFTNGHGAETMKILDKEARKVGASVEDVRKDFIEFSEAGMSNNVANSLVLLKADLGALGVTGEAAGKFLDVVLDKGHDIAQQQQALGYVVNRANAVIKGMHDAGSGAVAAAYATHSFGAAANQLKDAATEKLGEMWAKIGPGIAKAARALSDFIVKSPQAKEAIDAIGNAITAMAKNVSVENLNKALGGLKTVAKDVKEAWQAVNDAAQKATDFVGNVTGAFGPDTSNAKQEEQARNREFFDKNPTARAVNNAMNWIGLGKDEGDSVPSVNQNKSQSGSPSASVGFVIQNLNVSGGDGSPSDIAASIRREIQKLLQIGQMQRGALPNAKP